jgi:phosphate transport system permease protein
MLASTIAILTTVGIVLSMLFETFNFFQLYPWQEFFFGLEWRPSFEGGSELGLIPLLWGTLYISLIALLVAVPIGLFAAVYMAEYASKRVRSFAKPLIEILAGHPDHRLRPVRADHRGPDAARLLRRAPGPRHSRRPR